ncbi:uncharacterized protein LOC106458051 [Limulus polyphemus]|uniref:Uncharacterized protein LOC106458051 n=1 Tax=Limulus polyphemus TaxID=6850 RepID=A0ABM1B1L9_LIMPO|nr:uncharacterized protein LOC106458051 [Limulus polyphemus]
MWYSQDSSEMPVAQDILSVTASFNQRFHCFGRSCSEWTLLVLSLLNIFAVTGISTKELYSSISRGISYDPCFTFSVAILFTAVYGTPFIIQGVLYQQSHSLYLHLASVVLAVLYSVADYSFNKEHRDDFKIARMVIGLVFVSINIYLAVKVTTKITWTEFLIIGASDGMLCIYKKLCYFLMLLKLDLEAGVLLAIFSLTKALESNFQNIVIFTGITVYSLSLCVIGSIAVKKEFKLLVFLFIALNFALPVWIPFQVMYFECPLQSSCSHEDAVLAYTRLATGIFGILFQIYICIEVIKVYKNFDYGLTDRAFAGLVASESTNLLSRSRALNM